MTNDAKLALLTRVDNSWGSKEITEYFGFSRNKSISILRIAINNGGTLPAYEDNKRGARVFIDSVLSLFCTTKEEAIKQLKENE